MIECLGNKIIVKQNQDNLTSIELPPIVNSSLLLSR